MSGGAPSPAQVAAEVRAFNLRVQVGDPVKFWVGERSGPGVASVTRGRAMSLGGTRAVVLVQGYGAPIALSHVEATGKRRDDAS